MCRRFDARRSTNSTTGKRPTFGTRLPTTLPIKVSRESIRVLSHLFTSVNIFLHLFVACFLQRWSLMPTRWLPPIYRCPRLERSPRAKWSARRHRPSTCQQMRTTFMLDTSWEVSSFHRLESRTLSHLVPALFRSQYAKLNPSRLRSPLEIPASKTVN